MCFFVLFFLLYPPSIEGSGLEAEADEFIFEAPIDGADENGLEALGARGGLEFLEIVDTTEGLGAAIDEFLEEFIDEFLDEFLEEFIDEFLDIEELFKLDAPVSTVVVIPIKLFK